MWENVKMHTNKNDILFLQIMNLINENNKNIYLKRRKEKKKREKTVNILLFAFEKKRFCCC